MANYHSLKNAAILTPTTNTDLGSDANRYSNVYMSGNIVMSNGVTVTSSNVIAPRVASITYPGTETATDTAGGETITITGSGFSNTGGNPSVIIGSTIAPSATYVSSTSITFTTPALSAGSYVLYVINADGGTATFLTGLSYSGTPSWTTTAGSLGSVGSSASVNISVAATGDAPITYAVKAGSSLPSGLSLNTSTGAITGTAPTVSNSTTYNFTLTAKDGQNQPTDRTFSLSVVLSPSTVDYLVVAGGAGGGAFYYAGGGAAGGLLSATSYSISSGTYTVTVGAGGAAGVSSANGTSGANSVFGSITVTGGGGGQGNGATGGNGGSGGGSNAGGTAGKGIYPGSSYVSATRQGYDGGAGVGGGASGSAGGGGGAGAVGGSGNSNVSGGAGGTGSLITLTTAFAGTASTASTTTLTITAVSAGEIQVGTQVTGTGIPAGAYIKSLGTGTGGTGTYILSAAATATNTGVSITSSGRYFAGGGGGSCYQGSAGAGGAGGGGTGASNSTNVVSVAGATNTGGGGGGGCHDSGYGFPASGPAAAGGSGVVIIRHADTFPTQTTTGSPTVTTAGGYRIYKWTSSGSITF